jgi:uncharacterized protein (DUF697 family)
MGGFGPAVGFQRATGFGLGPFGEVGTGAEAATAAGQYHHAYGWVAVAGFEQGVQVFERRDVQRVALVGRLRVIQATPASPG